MKRFGRILLSIACAGVLQTALAVADIQTIGACVSAAAGSPEDIADCSQSNASNGGFQPSSPPVDARDGPSKLKDFGAGAGIERTKPISTTADSVFAGVSQPCAAELPVYLITRRLRI